MSRIPDLAWPTMAVFLAGSVLWAGGLAASMAGVLPNWLAVVTGLVAMYFLFMAMHEAAHSSISRNRLVNTVVGSMASIPFAGAFPIFRHAHLTHHIHANDLDEDPDFWSGGSPLLFKWATQDLRYVELYRNSSRRFSTRQRLHNTLVPSLILAVAIWLVYMGYWQSVLFAWLIPWRLAIVWLAYAFNYLPHAPHRIAQSENRFAATVCRQPRWLKWILLFQNYHNVHHLYPSAPFYRIEKMWDVGSEYFKQRGTRIV